MCWLAATATWLRGGLEPSATIAVQGALAGNALGESPGCCGPGPGCCVPLRWQSSRRGCKACCAGHVVCSMLVCVVILACLGPA